MSAHREIYVGRIDTALESYKKSCLEISDRAKEQITTLSGDLEKITEVLDWQKAEIEKAHEKFVEELHSIKGEFFSNLENTSKQVEEGKLKELDGLLDQI